METRVCSKCRKKMPMTEKYFPIRIRNHKYPSMRYSYYCKECNNKYHRNYDKTWIEKRRKQGLCSDCGKKNIDGTKWKCRDCSKKGNKAHNKRRIKRIKKGLCRDCGKKAIEGIRYCEKCLWKKKMRKWSDYAERKKNNICVIDGCGERARIGFIHCEHHAEMFKSYGKKRVNKNRDNGCCAQCGNPVFTNSYYCDECIDRRNYNLAKY